MTLDPHEAKASTRSECLLAHRATSPTGWVNGQVPICV